MKKILLFFIIIIIGAVCIFRLADQGLDQVISNIEKEETKNTLSLEELKKKFNSTKTETKQEETSPVETMAAESMPEETLSEETSVGETTAAQKIPETKVPETTVPETTTPETTAAETTVSNLPAPEDSEEIKKQLQNKFYYSTLSAAEQKIYRQIYYAVLNLTERVYVDTDVEFARAKLILDWVWMDCPECFWISNTRGRVFSSLDQDTGKRQIRINYSLTQAEIEQIGGQIEEKVSSIMDQMPDGSDYEKVKWTFEYLVKNTIYDMSAKDIRDIQGIFLDGKAVCMGYARGFCLLMQRAEIPCAVVWGTVDSGGHEWNAVELDGNFYYVDATWGDPVINGTTDYPDGANIDYNYLCTDDAFILQTHQFNREECPIPRCNAGRYR